MAALLLGIAILGRKDAVAAGGITVSINAPAQVVKGDTFTATVDIANVTAFDAGQFDVSFNESLVQLDSVTAGLAGTTQIPIALWNKTSTGTCRIIVNVPGVPGVTGSGYLAVLHFHAASSVVGSSAVSLSNGFLNNNLGSEITATWVGDSVSVCEPLVTTAPSVTASAATNVATTAAGHASAIHGDHLTSTAATATRSGGLPTWALVLITVGVAVVTGVGTVVFLMRDALARL
jgi:hypothetical protein